MALGATLLLALLQGCVYLRLLDVKSQLADFDAFIDVSQEAGGLRLAFEDPTLKQNDLKLLGVVPIRKQETAAGEVWEIEMVKRYASPELSEGGRFDLSTTLMFEEGRLSSILIPSKYVECFSPELFVGTIEAMGESKVQALKREVAVSPEGLAGATRAVGYRRIVGTFGIPFEERAEDDRLYLTYSYKKSEPEDLPEERRSDRTYEVTFALDGREGRLLSANTRSIFVRYVER